MPRTARLFDELSALHALAEQSVQYQWGRGLVQAWRGDVPSARHALRAAIDLATTSTDHWITFECSVRLALLELEAGEVDRAGSICAQLGPLAEKLGEGSERALAAAVSAVHAIALGAHDGELRLDRPSLDWNESTPVSSPLTRSASRPSASTGTATSIGLRCGLQPHARLQRTLTGRSRTLEPMLSWPASPPAGVTATVLAAISSM